MTKLLRRDVIVQTARQWLGTPFRHQGRTRGKWCDCVGLIVSVGHELGMEELHAPSDYAMSPASNLVLSYAERQLVKLDHKNLQPGQVAIMWGFDRHEAQHLGIIGEYAGRHTLIHAFSRPGKVVEQTFDSFWMKRLVCLLEYPNTEPYGA